LIAALTVLFGAANAHAHLDPLVSCLATKVYDSTILKESLSVEEYPDVEVNEENAWLGASLYRKSEGHIIVSKRMSNERLLVFVGDPEGGVLFLIDVDMRTMEGKLHGQVGDGDTHTLIADLVCNE